MRVGGGQWPGVPKPLRLLIPPHLLTSHSLPSLPSNQVSHTNSAAIKTDMYKAALETLGEVST